ncbi:hypothetical protein NDU88_006009 [Pleurodeles waltl]|uniref:Uncharacterized protein n=1 Tax=Pleurodeles waltl TaxID=8319 RepID=A0AAV7L643_PLEWA|nr:hypothetical protein NDU88_006009 [Pleurodeles waltl]
MTHGAPGANEDISCKMLISASNIDSPNLRSRVPAPIPVRKLGSHVAPCFGRSLSEPRFLLRAQSTLCDPHPVIPDGYLPTELQFRPRSPRRAPCLIIGDSECLLSGGPEALSPRLVYSGGPPVSLALQTPFFSLLTCSDATATTIEGVTPTGQEHCRGDARPTPKVPTTPQAPASLPENNKT